MRELKDFNGLFDIVCSLGRSNHIDISYLVGHSKVMVFSITYRREGAKNCEVRVFSEANDWQKALAFNIEHKDEILAELQAKKTEAQLASERLIEQQKEAIILRERAKKLKLL